MIINVQIQNKLVIKNGVTILLVLEADKDFLQVAVAPIF